MESLGLEISEIVPSSSLGGNIGDMILGKNMKKGK
jgi:hypothetical protein